MLFYLFYGFTDLRRPRSDGPLLHRLAVDKSRDGGLSAVNRTRVRADGSPVGLGLDHFERVSGSGPSHVNSWRRNRWNYEGIFNSYLQAQSPHTWRDCLKLTHECFNRKKLIWSQRKLRGGHIILVNFQLKWSEKVKSENCDSALKLNA